MRIDPRPDDTTMTLALRNRVEQLLKDVAKLEPGYRRDVVCDAVETLDMMVQPTAAERVAGGMSDATAVGLVDARCDWINRLLRPEGR